MNITLKIDGREIKAKTGMTVLEVARKAGIYIPTLCDHPQLKPSGSCRLCVVEIKGIKEYPTSCTTPAEDGMVVRTESRKLRSLRRQILELTLSEHPYTCLVCNQREECDEWMGTIRKVGVTTGCQTCPKNGACELQNLVQYFGIKEIDFPITYRSYPVEQEDPFFDRDYNLCILCGRCVRVCNEVRHNGTLAFGFRGDRTVVGTAFGKSHVDAGCEFCGACVDVCPTGALYDKRSKWEGRPDRSKHSVCPYCSVGCSVSFNLKGNRIISTAPYKNGTLNRGHICVRGRFAVVDVVQHPERLKRPMIKHGERWVETSWEHALNLVAEKFKQYKGDAFALIASPQGTNEDAYALQKFGRAVMESHQLSISSPFARNDYVDSLVQMQKIDGIHTTVDGIDQAGAIVVLGADLSVSHPVAALKIKQAHQNGAKLVVIDPRKTKLAELSDIHVRLRPGKDIFLIAGLIKFMMDRGLVDSAVYSDQNTFVKLKKQLERINLESIERETGVHAGMIAKLAAVFVQHRPLLFLYGSGLALQVSTRENLSALFDLAMLIDNAKILPVLGECNLMGCLEMGCYPDLLPGLISMHEDEARKRFEKKWGVDLKIESKLDLPGIVERINKGIIRSLYLIGELPDLEDLKKLEFIVIQSVFAPAWVDRADVILPAAHLSEVDGTVTNFEGRLQRLRKIIKPLGMAKPDWWICSEIAKKMGASGFSYQKSADVFEEMVSVIQSYYGLTIEKIRGKGLHLARLKTPDKQIDRQFLTFPIEEEEKKHVGAYRFTFMDDRGFFHYRNASLVKTVSGMERIVSEGQVEVHPEDAQQLHIQDGDRIRIRSRDGFLFEGSAIITDRVQQKTAYLLCDKNVLPTVRCFRGNHYSVKIEKVVYESDCR